MSKKPPIPCIYLKGAFRPLRRAQNLAAAHYAENEIVLLEPVEERSEVSHSHEFAWLREAWLNLPEHLVTDYPSPEHLRKRALIAKGWCTVRDYPCASRKEAERLASTLRGELDEYAVVVVSDAVVRVCRAKSQARNRMRKADFQASKTDILDWVSDLIGVTPEALTRARAA